METSQQKAEKHRPRQQPRHKTGSYLTIEPKKGATVPVAVWEIKKEDEANLNMYEGFLRFYYKKEFRVRCRYLNSGRVRTLNTLAYIMDKRRKLGDPNSYTVIKWKINRI